MTKIRFGRYLILSNVVLLVVSALVSMFLGWTWVGAIVVGALACTAHNVGWAAYWTYLYVRYMTMGGA